MNRKKIVFLTGTRADFGKLKSLINKVESSELFECHIFITGMHMLSKYGFTYLEISKLNYKNIHPFINQNSKSDMDTILSNTILGFSNYIKELQPDMIIIHGDRIEALAGALVGSLNNILVAHIEGGEISGTIDELIRHSITKLSHIHFVANKKAKKRLIQMGENRNSIFIIGSPEVDVMLSKDLPEISEVKNHYDITFEKFALFVYHPVTTEINKLKKNITSIINSLNRSDYNYIGLYPNNDEGSEIILRELLKLKDNKKFRILPSFRFEAYLTLLKNSEFIIGNSSSGIREAGVYGIPAINIGTRQKNRSRNNSITNIEPNNSEILEAIKNIIGKKVKISYEFGLGNSSEKFLKIIRNKDIWKIPIQKQFIDLD